MPPKDSAIDGAPDSNPMAPHMEHVRRRTSLTKKSGGINAPPQIHLIGVSLFLFVVWVDHNNLNVADTEHIIAIAILAGHLNL